MKSALGPIKRNGIVRLSSSPLWRNRIVSYLCAVWWSVWFVFIGWNGEARGLPILALFLAFGYYVCYMGIVGTPRGVANRKGIRLVYPWGWKSIRWNEVARIKKYKYQIRGDGMEFGVLVKTAFFFNPWRSFDANDRNPSEVIAILEEFRSAACRNDATN